MASFAPFAKKIRFGKYELGFADLVFAAAFIAAAVLFFANAPAGVTNADESQYQYVCLRLMKGEKLFADNWMIVSMQTVFQYLPFRVFYALHGGTAGLVLAMRRLYVCVKLIFFAYIYIRLRRYGLWAVLAGALSVGTDIFGMKTLSHYAMSWQAALLAGMLLFVREEPRPVHCIAAGFLFSCCVLNIPVSAAVWFLYGALVLLRLCAKKKGRALLSAYDFILAPQRWLYIFYGVLIAAALFLLLCACLFTGTRIGGIAEGIRAIFSFVNSESASGVSFWAIRGAKLLRYARLYHPALSALFLAVYFCGVVLHRFTKRFEKPFFAALCALYAAMSVRLLLLPDGFLPDASGECVCHPLLISLLAAAAYVFTPRKNRRLFAFLLLGFAVSATMDVYSNNTFGSLLLCGAAPSVLLLRDYVLQTAFLPARPEAGASKHKKKTPAAKGKVWLAAVCALLAAIPALEVWHALYMAGFHETERLFCRSDAPLDARIDTGVLKGIVTVPQIREDFENSARDASRLRGACRNTLFVIDYDVTVYLNTELPAAVPILHFSGNDWSREEAWWAKHPEKRPDAVYVPFSTLSYIDYEDPSPEEKLAWFSSRAETAVEKGENGYIVRILKWY